MFDVKIRIKDLNGKVRIEQKKMSVLSLIVYLINLGFKSDSKFRIISVSLDIKEVE